MKLYPNVTLMFTTWFLAVLLIAFFGFSNLPNSPFFPKDFLLSFANWDGRHYISIAETGYAQKIQYAFFPLYPLLIKTLNQLVNNYLVSALLISITASFLSMHVLYKLISLDFGKIVAEKTILLLLFFPASFFFLTAYTESLFFFLAVTSFYFLRVNKLVFAVFFAMFVSATRLVGLAVVLGLIVEVYAKDGINKNNWFVFLSPLGFFAYCYYLYTQTGDPFYFLTAELNWQRAITIPGVGFWETLKSLSTPGFILAHFNSFLDLIFAIFGLGFAIRAFRFLPPAYSVYSLASIIFPLVTPTLSSMPRFLLVIFPVFLLLALIKNKYLTLAYEIVGLMLLSVYVVLFINGFWVS